METPQGLIASFELPIQTVNPLNGRQGNWMQKANRRKEERGLTKLVASAHLRANALPRNIVVKLTRGSYGELDDDGLRAAFKSVRDGMADFLGINDKHVDLVRYDYAQVKTVRGEWWARVEIYPMQNATAQVSQLDAPRAQLAQ